MSVELPRDGASCSRAVSRFEGQPVSNSCCLCVIKGTVVRDINMSFLDFNSSVTMRLKQLLFLSLIISCIAE